MAPETVIVLHSIAVDDELVDRPIDPTWIIEGTPKARARALAFSPEASIGGMVWESTAGRFDWRYGGDEVIHVLVGEAELTLSDGSTRSIREGDVVFFSRGQVVRWHIPHYLKKVAMSGVSTSIPRRIAHQVPFLRRTVRRVKAMRAPAG